MEILRAFGGYECVVFIDRHESTFFFVTEK